jgi:AcrR family transcriptional regulator
MAPRAKTRDRILEASLALFNAQGERNVTTNHIAAHLGISPGNLYYHFPNKQAIVAELFGQYEATVAGFLQLPEDRSVTLGDKAGYLEALLGSIWQYRFVQRNLEQLLDDDPELGERYRRFVEHHLRSARAVYQGFVDAGLLLMSSAQVLDMTLNAWIIITSWVRFLHTSGIRSDRLSEAALRRGVYQVLALEDGFVAAAARAGYVELCQRYRVALTEPYG